MPTSLALPKRIFLMATTCPVCVCSTGQASNQTGVSDVINTYMHQLLHLFVNGLEHNAKGSLAKRLMLLVCIHRLQLSLQGVHVLHLCRLSRTLKDVRLPFPHIG